MGLGERVKGQRYMRAVANWLNGHGAEHGAGAPKVLTHLNVSGELGDSEHMTEDLDG